MYKHCSEFDTLLFSCKHLQSIDTIVWQGIKLLSCHLFMFSVNQSAQNKRHIHSLTIFSNDEFVIDYGRRIVAGAFPTGFGSCWTTTGTLIDNTRLSLSLFDQIKIIVSILLLGIYVFLYKPYAPNTWMCIVWYRCCKTFQRQEDANLPFHSLPYLLVNNEKEKTPTRLYWY